MALHGPRGKIVENPCITAYCIGGHPDLVNLQTMQLIILSWIIEVGLHISIMKTLHGHEQQPILFVINSLDF